MKVSAVSFVLFLGIGAGCATAPARAPSSVRDTAYPVSEAELRATPAFENAAGAETPYDTVHRAFGAGVAASLDEVFPPCLDADGATVRRLARQTSTYLRKDTTFQIDGGHQYCRLDFEFATGEVRAARGALFPPVPAQPETWSGAFRMRVAEAPFPLSPTDRVKYRSTVKERRLACETKENALVCVDVIDPKIARFSARKVAGRAGEPAAYVFRVESKDMLAAANAPAAADAATPETVAPTRAVASPTYLYVWETPAEP